MSGTEAVIIITAIATLITAIFTGLAHMRIKSSCCSVEPDDQKDEHSQYSHESDT